MTDNMNLYKNISYGLSVIVHTVSLWNIRCFNSSILNEKRCSYEEKQNSEKRKTRK